MITPRLDGGTQPFDLRLDPENAVEYDLADPERVAEWKSARKLETPGARGREEVYFCGAGLRSFHIDAYGRPVRLWFGPLSSYELTQGTFRDGWQVFLSQVRGTRRATAFCTDCHAVSLCCQCPGLVQ